MTETIQQKINDLPGLLFSFPYSYSVYNMWREIFLFVDAGSKLCLYSSMTA